MAAVGTLAAGVAHEVNNPLTYVLANLEEARAELPASGDLSGRIDDALEGARRIQHVVAELASFAGGQDDDAPVPLGLVLDASIRLTRNDVRHRARLVTDYDPSLMVAGGKNKLGQLFLNLLINAIQAIPLGDATGHEIRIGARVSGPGRVQVSVRDTGVGIDAAVARSIFEPFVSTKGGATGGGLGLFVCRNIVRDLGGEITVESAPGQGATFTVELPGGPGELPDPPSDPPAASPKRGARSVLIVDDEPVVRRVLSRIFKTWETVEAGGGREALAHIEERSFDAIICDLMMPEMTGMEFFAQVGKTAPALQHRFVFVTGAAFTQEAARFVDTVRRPVLNKPFQRAELVALVEEIAEGQEAGL
jgi:CheY-like chemotaxis protein